jgi:nucleoside-diphosphate-sugar epimerase
VNVLVLGGSVFVGRRLVAALAHDGHEVSVLNRGHTPTQLPDGVDHLIADRTDPAALTAALAGTEWDAVVDVSGFVMAAGGGDIAHLLDLLDGRVGAYVYISSIMAYDQALVGPVSEPAAVWREDLPTNRDGTTSYGGFKAAAEHAMLDRHTSTGFPATILRPAAIYGPDNNIFDMETPMFLRLRRHLPILVPHDGAVTGSYGHVDDLCDLIVAALGGGAAGEVINATGGPLSALDYVHTLAAVVGEEPDIVPVAEADTPPDGPPLWSHLFEARHHAVLDTTKATDLLGHRPRFDAATGHADTYDWFRAQGWTDTDEARIDPVWRATWDFAAEAAMADRARGSQQ